MGAVEFWGGEGRAGRRGHQAGRGENIHGLPIA